MNRKPLFSFCLLMLLIQFGFTSRVYAQESPIQEKERKLREFVKSIQLGADLAVTGGMFFDEFPSDFRSFIALYGFNKGKPGPLYSVYHDHIKILAKLTAVVGPNAYAEKLVSVSIGGKWEADGVASFQQVVREFTLTYTLELARSLGIRTDGEIAEFWVFYFDSPHVQRKLFDGLNRLRKYDERIYRIMWLEYNKALEKDH